MAFQGPVYGLSRECHLKAQAKFDLDRALHALNWVKEVTDLEIEPPNNEKGIKDQFDFAECLKDGVALCILINVLQPGAVPKMNSSKSLSIFKQRENLEMFITGCQKYGLKAHDLFQVNDLYEKKNLYTVVNCLYALGGMAQKKEFNGPIIGVKVADANRRSFSKEILSQSQTILGRQLGSNKGASQSGMTPYGAPRQIIPDGR